MSSSSGVDKKMAGGERRQKLDPETLCNVLVSSHASSVYSIVVIEMLLILASSKFLHVILRRIGQPRLLCDLATAAVVANLSAVRRHFDFVIGSVIDPTGEFVLAAYLFVLGLEMDPRLLIRRPGPELSLAYCSIVSNILFIHLFIPVLIELHVSNYSGGIFPTIPALTIVFATTSSHVLTRLVTELKFGRSYVGRFAISASIVSDMAATLFMVVCYTMYFFLDKKISKSLIVVAYLATQTVFLITVVIPVMEWMNEQNPEGKPVKGPYMIVAFGIPAGLGALASIAGFDWKLNSFLVGLILPGKGRISSFLISRINFALTYFVLPFYFVLLHMKTTVNLNPSWNTAGDKKTKRKRTSSDIILSKVGVFTILGVVGKTLGTGYAGIMMYNMRWEDAFRIGLLLNVKGPYHFLAAHMAVKDGYIDNNTMLSLMISFMISIAYFPVVAATVRQRVRRAQKELKGLQWHDLAEELPLLVCLQGPRDVPVATSIVEAMRLGAASVALYAMDMIQMTERAAAVLVHGDSPEEVTVLDDVIVETREHIGAGLEAYRQQIDSERLAMRRLLAIAPFDDMHHDVCDGAEDVHCVMILLPYHRRQMSDGRMCDGKSGFRYVSQKVLRHAPCTVGVVVDRDLIRATQVSTENLFRSIAVVFIGGKDDREALALAGLIARHPGIQLTIVRFMAEPAVQEKANREGHHCAANEAETRADYEYFSAFREQHSEGTCMLEYMEMEVKNGAETVAALRSVAERCELLVVGRGEGRGSVVTAGMNEWGEHGDLGPVGDVLAASDFSTTASVLVIQQHDNRRDLKVIDDDFLPMQM